MSFAAVTAAGKWLAWPAYKQMREDRWVRMAGAAFSEEDHATAMGFVRKAIQASPRNVDAWRLAEKITRAANSPERMFVLTQLVELEKDNMELRLDLVEQAIVLRTYEEAFEMLQTVDEETMNTARFHRLAVALSIIGQQPGPAEYHLQELENLNSGDDSIRLALARLRIQNPDTGIRGGAGETLHSLKNASDPEVRLGALRTLLSRAIAEQNAVEGETILEEIRAEGEALTLSDRILILHAVMDFDPQRFEQEFGELRGFAGNDPLRIPPVARFLLRRDRSAEAREWLESLPEETRNLQPVLMVFAETVSAMRDLEALADCLRIEWAHDDFHRLASLAHTLRVLDRSREAAENWQRAVIAASADPEQLRTLYQLTVDWNWNEERFDLLERIFRGNPRENWAFKELVAIHFQRKNTSELLRVFSRKLEYHPEDHTTANNFAYLCFLQNIHGSRAHRLAQENFDLDPANPAFVSTYALSLYRQGRLADALKTLETLSDEELREQPRSLHYALILAANDRLEEAEEYLATLQSENLLPEERALRRRAKNYIFGPA